MELWTEDSDPPEDVAFVGHRGLESRRRVLKRPVRKTLNPMKKLGGQGSGVNSPGAVSEKSDMKHPPSVTWSLRDFITTSYDRDTPVATGLRQTRTTRNPVGLRRKMAESGSGRVILELSSV